MIITRPIRLLASLVVLASVVAACGSDPDTSGSADTVAASPEATVDDSDDAYPVTVEHKYGATTIDARPERIAVVGLTEQDPLLALGVAPIAVTEWFGGYDYAAWPWAQPYLADAEPVVLDNTDGVPFEQIAGLRPDLIVGLYAGLSQEEFDTLSEIAPTVAQPGEYVDWGIPWQEETITIGRIVGQSERAEEMVAEVEAQFEAVKAEHPEFAGATGAAATPYEGIWVYATQDVRGRFLDSLGFVMPDELAALDTTGEFGFDLSLERVDLLDLDLLVWLDAEEGGDAFRENAVYNSLAVHTEGREVMLDSEAPDALGGAMSFVTVLSIPFLLEGVVPMLAAAVDGDPAT